jgi:hypothetical protein
VIPHNTTVRTVSRKSSAPPRFLSLKREASSPSPSATECSAAGRTTRPRLCNAASTANTSEMEAIDAAVMAYLDGSTNSTPGRTGTKAPTDTPPPWRRRRMRPRARVRAWETTTITASPTQRWAPRTRTTHLPERESGPMRSRKNMPKGGEKVVDVLCGPPTTAAPPSGALVSKRNYPHPPCEGGGDKVTSHNLVR